MMSSLQGGIFFTLSWGPLAKRKLPYSYAQRRIIELFGWEIFSLFPD
jgi:hypothetical protein